MVDKLKKAIYVDGKLYCTICNKQMLPTPQLKEFTKKAILDVVKETRDITNVDKEKVEKRMRQLNICLHGGYGGIQVGDQRFVLEKVHENKITSDEVPPTEIDELEEKLSKLVYSMIQGAKRKGLSNDEILHVIKRVCIERGNAPFSSEDLDRVLRPMIEKFDMK